MKSDPKIPIALWSGPRNVSTALMYSFANRNDCRVIDEPLFGYFLKQTNVWRPSRDETLEVMETNPEIVLRDMMIPDGKEFVFSKNMANHLEGLDINILARFRNVILTREPAAVLGSYRKKMQKPTALDLCYSHQLIILEYLRAHGLPFLVINSDHLRNDPERELRYLCDFLGIDFLESMLSWSAGSRDEDGVWAKYWYHHVHKSTGFAPAPQAIEPVPPEFMKLHQASTALYQQIISFKYE